MSAPGDTTRKATPASKKLEMLEYWNACGSVKQTVLFFSPASVGKEYESKRKELYAWKKKRTKIEGIARGRTTAHLKRLRPRGSGTALTGEVELRIVAWVNRLRGDGVPVTSLMLKIRAKVVA